MEPVTNRHELSYFQLGYYLPTRPNGDGINDVAQLAKAIGYSRFYLQAQAWDRIKELTSVVLQSSPRGVMA